MDIELGQPWEMYEHSPGVKRSRRRPVRSEMVSSRMRTGDGAPGPLDRRGTKRGCGACVIERILRPMNERMHERLRTLHIRHVWDDYGAGTHDWPYWRRDLRQTLPDLMRVLASG